MPRRPHQPHNLHPFAALGEGPWTRARLRAAKAAPLPERAALLALLGDLDDATVFVLCWLRADLRRLLADRWGGIEALRWLLGSNTRAAAVAYDGPAWWGEWLHSGLPAAQAVLMRLEGRDIREILPAYPRICANLLLARAATGEGHDALLALAAADDLPAVRALALLPKVDDAVLAVLLRRAREGGLPVMAAARVALDHLARRQGLPGMAELERQRLLAAAWDPGPLGEERVRADWRSGQYRLRLGLRAGKAALEVLGPEGPLPRVPEALRTSELYREARGAQRAIQAQYRRFRAYLERCMVEGTPLPAGQFRYLLENPVFADLAERIAWRTAEGETVLWAGPSRWESLSGASRRLGAPDDLTIAIVHPVALSREGVLTAWQQHAADHRLVQPFRQLFREVYTPGHDGTRCQRFAGRGVAPGRAYALLRSAGFAPGNGTARRLWPGGIMAHICWAEGAVGHDLFGPGRLPEVRTGEVWFMRDGEALPLAEVDPVMASETLRAADLLTTCAAVGEAELTSAESTALRAELLRQMARSFDLTNLAVPEGGRYALVLGAHATYRVNLASGTVLLEPEGRQITVPGVDPRWQPQEDADATTEIIATILALAHDEEISDLTFLAQL